MRPFVSTTILVLHFTLIPKNTMLKMAPNIVSYQDQSAFRVELEADHVEINLKPIVTQHSICLVNGWLMVAKKHNSNAWISQVIAIKNIVALQMVRNRVNAL